MKGIPMRTVIICLTATVCFGLLCSAQEAPQAPSVGAKAPDFSLPYATRDSVSGSDLALSALVGKRTIVLAFYPADWSGGCTKEVCTLRDNFSALADLNAEVIGVSGDYIFSHHEWAQHHNLPFILASDHRHETAKKYGSYNDAYGYNNRTVFVIDKRGLIAYADLHYSVKDMASFEKLKDALKKLQ
jgi:peroxiredoxin